MNDRNDRISYTWNPGSGFSVPGGLSSCCTSGRAKPWGIQIHPKCLRPARNGLQWQHNDYNLSQWFRWWWLKYSRVLETKKRHALRSPVQVLHLSELVGSLLSEAVRKAGATSKGSGHPAWTLLEFSMDSMDYPIILLCMDYVVYNQSSWSSLKLYTFRKLYWYIKLESLLIEAFWEMSLDDKKL